MIGSAKRRTLLIFGLVILIVGIIAASLPQLKLQPGMPLPSFERNQVEVQPAGSEPSAVMPVNTFFSVFFAVLLAVALVYILYKLIRGDRWKEMAGFIRVIVIIGLIFAGILFLILQLPSSGQTISAENLVPTPEPVVTSPLGAVPPALIWLAGIGLLLIAILVGVWIATSASRRKKPIDLVGLEAEKAWRALKTGLDLKDVIIKCYRQMSLAVKEDQGLERKDFMTTGDFEELLEAAGIPHDPIHQLTRLFEAVRYGNWQPNPSDEQKAIHCLEDIISFSQAAKATK